MVVNSVQAVYSLLYIRFVFQSSLTNTDEYEMKTRDERLQAEMTLLLMRQLLN